MSQDGLPRMDANWLGNRGYDPINELMRAIILRTIDDYHSGGEFKEEAVQYLYKEDDEYIFSFYSICKHLGFDPDKTRYSIMHATHKISTRRRAA
jgi:hypothetical protein